MATDPAMGIVPGTAIDLEMVCDLVTEIDRAMEIVLEMATDQGSEIAPAIYRAIDLIGFPIVAIAKSGDRIDEMMSAIVGTTTIHIGTSGKITPTGLAGVGIVPIAGRLGEL